MRQWLATTGTALVFLAGSLTTASASTETSTGDPTALYGDSIIFDVIRNGDVVGNHHVKLEKTGQIFNISSAFKLEIKLLFLVAYRFQYLSKEVWENGNLQSLTSQVNDDGDKTLIELSSDGSQVTISGPEGEIQTQRPLFVTTHWNADVIGQKRILNTITGLINKVEIKKMDRQSISTETGPVTATRYAYEGELRTEVWYDDAGRWVKMKFKGRDGSDIEYKCVRCQGGAIARASHAG